MKKIFLILVFAVSFLNSVNLVKGDSNVSTVQAAIEKVADTSSIANNAIVNSALDNSIIFFKKHVFAFAIVISIVLLMLYFANYWGRILIIVFVVHILYQSSGINMQFPLVDILYSGFAFWNINLLIRRLHKYFEKNENKNLATKINLILHIFDMLIFVITVAFMIKSFHIQNIEVVTTGMSLAIFIIIRKDLNNLKSFLTISWDDFLSIGDKIVIDSIEGRILYINKFTTIFQSDNGNIGKIPNSDLLEKIVINKSKNKKNLKKEEK